MNLSIREFQITETCDDTILSLFQGIINDLSVCIDNKFRKMSGNYKETLFYKPDTKSCKEIELVQTGKDLACMLLNTLEKNENNPIDLIFSLKPGYFSRETVAQILYLLYTEENDNLNEYLAITKQCRKMNKIIRKKFDELSIEKNEFAKLFCMVERLKSTKKMLKN